MASIVRITEA